MVSRLGTYSAETKKRLTEIGIRVEHVPFTSVSPQIDLTLDRPLQMSMSDSTTALDLGPFPFALTMLERKRLTKHTVDVGKVVAL